MAEEIFVRTYQEPSVVIASKVIGTVPGGSPIRADIPKAVMVTATSTLRLSESTLQVEIVSEGGKPRISTFQVRKLDGDFVVVGAADGEPLYVLWRDSATSVVWAGYSHQKLP